MNLEQLWLIGGAALALFWMLGAHNRLVALRNAIMAAWAQVDEPLQRRSAAVGALAAGLREPLRDEQGALEAVMTAQAQLQALHQLGVRILLDDCGRGDASLGLLRRFPFAAVKLDRDLVVQVVDHYGRVLRGEPYVVRTDQGDHYFRWKMMIRFKRFKKNRDTWTVGMSHLRFNAQGLVVYHQDYWNAADGIFRHIPVLGNMINAVINRL